MVPESLMQLLKTNGMFYSNSAEMKILPLVVYKDNLYFKNYFWWGGNSPFVSKRGKSFLRNFHKKLTANLKENKFSVIEPIRKKYFKKIPVEQQFLKLSPSDVKAIAKAIGANMVILGEITVGKGMKVNETYTVGYNIRAVQVEGMKTISTAKEVFTSLPGSFRSSVPQLVKRSHQSIIAKLGSGFKNIWNEGQMGAKIYTITLNLPTMKKKFKKINIVSSQELKKGTKIAIISTGTIGNLVSKVINDLDSNTEIGHYNMPFIKPLDINRLKTICINYEAIITIEDGCISGGFGSAISEYILDNKYKNTIKILGIPDIFIEHGSVEELHKIAKIDYQTIKKSINELRLS